MSFVSDLKIGEEAQFEFAKQLLSSKQKRIVSIEFAQGKFKDWDIKTNSVPNGEETYEVKSDTMAPQTGNFVIETRFKGKPSGIYTSKADFIVYFVKGEWRIQERGELILRLLKTEKKETKGGDGWNSDLYVIKCEELPNLFMPLNELC